MSERWKEAIRWFFVTAKAQATICQPQCATAKDTSADKEI